MGQAVAGRELFQINCSPQSDWKAQPQSDQHRESRAGQAAEDAGKLRLAAVAVREECSIELGTQAFLVPQQFDEGDLQIVDLALRLRRANINWAPRARAGGLSRCQRHERFALRRAAFERGDAHDTAIHQNEQ